MCLCVCVCIYVYVCVCIGHVEAGESLCSAAVRETQEEAGVDIELLGILRVRHRAGRRGDGRAFVRFSVIFFAQPRDVDQLPKVCLCVCVYVCV